MDDRVVAIVAAVFLILATLGYSRLNPRAPSPVLFHNLAWIGSLVLFSLGWVRYDSMGTHAWVLIILGIVTFNLGVFIPTAVEPRGGGWVPPPPRRVPFVGAVIPILFTFGVAWYLKSLIGTFGFHVLLHNPGLARSNQGDSDFVTSFALPGRLMYSLGPLVFVSHAVPWIVGLDIGRLRRWGVLLFTTVAMVASLGRTYLFVSILWTVAAVFISRSGAAVTRISPRRRRLVIVGACVVAVVSFQLLANVLGKNESTEIEVQQYVNPPLTGSPFTSAYVYSTAGIVAFGREVSGAQPVLVLAGPDLEGRVGWATFYPFDKLIPGWKVDPAVRPFVAVPFPFNAYTWFDSFYRDFGQSGIIFGPLCIGIIVGSLVLRRRRTPEGTLIASLLLGMTAFAPFLTKFNDPAIWDLVICLSILSLFRSKPIKSGGAQLPVIESMIYA